MINKGFSLIGLFFLSLLSYLPFPVLYFLSSVIYYPLYYGVKYRRRVVRENLVNSFPAKSLEDIILIEKKFYRHLADLLFENIKLHSISRKEMMRRVTFTGLDKMDEYYQQGKNLMMCTGHYCNWEMVSLSYSLYNTGKTIVIYKPLNNKQFEGWFDKWRTKFGALFVPMRQTLRAVNSQESRFTLSFASDQSPVREDAKYFLDFLHQPTAALLGVEKIAKKTNSPIFYFKTNRIKRGFYSVESVLMCADPVNTEPYEITRMHFKILEEIILAKPEYWLWSHNRWKHKPQPEA